MAKRSCSGRPEMIHCPYCGEDYSSTYKHCPFCDEVEQPVVEEGLEELDAPRPRGGKRLTTNTRGGGYGGGPSPLRIIGTVVSLGLIIAAVIIVITLIMPLVSRGNVDGPGAASIPPVEEGSPAPDETVSAGETTPAGETAPVGETTPPATESPAGETIPADQTATGFTLSQSEFSFSDTWPNPITISVTFIPAGSTGTITWSSSDPDVASVDENGVVSHGTVRGTATITATMAGGVTQTCLVYNQVTSGTSSSSGGSSGATSSGTLSLNHTDFTFSALDNPSVQMRVNGTSSTPTWSIGNSAVATISADGVVRPAGSGTTTITCTVDGQTLTCIVRCTF